MVYLQMLSSKWTLQIESQNVIAKKNLKIMLSTIKSSLYWQINWHFENLNVLSAVMHLVDDIRTRSSKCLEEFYFHNTTFPKLFS